MKMVEERIQSQTRYIVFLFIIALLTVNCSDNKKYYDTYVLDEINKYDINDGQISTIDLSKTFGVDWDTMYIFTREIPEWMIKEAVGSDFKRGYNRFILKYKGSIVFNDSIESYDSSTFWEDFNRMKVVMLDVDKNGHFKEYRLFTNPHFRVRRAGDCYYLNPIDDNMNSSIEHSLPTTF